MENTWIEYKSKKIIVNDFTGIKMEKDMVSHLNGSYKLIEQEPGGTELRILVDLTGTFVTPGFLDAARKFEKDVLDRYKAKRAVLGITGPKEVLLKGFNLFTKQKLIPFHSRQEALEYLVK